MAGKSGAKKAVAKSAAPEGTKATKVPKQQAAGAAGADADKKKRKKARTETFSTYLFKVLRQINDKMGVSKRAMSIMNSFVTDIFERIALEASRLCRYTNKSTLSAREIQTAVRLTLPGDLAKHALVEGTKAVSKYTASLPAKSTKASKTA